MAKICAYCCSYTIKGNWSVDHFIPKSLHPKGAYEWDNFRFARDRLNNYKDNYQDVLDPFILSEGWFQLDFSSFLLKPNPSLVPLALNEVWATINRLHLNLDNDYVNERTEVIRRYCKGEITFDYIETNYPFIGKEMIRQDFDTTFLQNMIVYFNTNP